MESWDVLIIGAGPAALRSAISCADEGITPLLIDSSGIGSASGYAPISGLAASIDEISAKSHIEDTIQFGGEHTNPDSAARICRESVPVLSELERWGLNFRRREGGLPLASDVPGHSVPRLTGCGDSTIREITRILEEQVIKRGVHRRADILPVELVVDNYQIRGVTVLNIQTGEIYSIQSKTVILATEGYQGLWSSINDGDASGLALAKKCGIRLKGMQKIPKHPLTIKGYNIHIPVDVLGSGGRIRKGELIIDALKRVALEEVGLVIKDHNYNFLGAFDHIYENSIFSTEARPSSTHYVALGFHYQIRAEEVSQVENPQHSELSWMSLKTASSIEGLHKLSHDYILALSQESYDTSKNGNT